MKKIKKFIINKNVAKGYIKMCLLEWLERGCYASAEGALRTKVVCLVVATRVFLILFMFCFV